MYQPEPVYTISPILKKYRFLIKLNKSERDHELYTESYILIVIIKSSDRIQKSTKNNINSLKDLTSKGVPSTVFSLKRKRRLTSKLFQFLI